MTDTKGRRAIAYVAAFVATGALLTVAMTAIMLRTQQPAVFPPLTAKQQEAKQSLIESVSVASNTPRPNIILIFADDLGYADIGCYGSTEIPTPHIDALATEGTRFTNAYVTAATCSPSRAGLLTGRYQQRFGFEFNTGSAKATERFGRGLDLSAPTIADLLRKAGYRTGMVDKWHLGTREQYHPINRGFDEFYGFLAGQHDYIPADQLSKDEQAIDGAGSWVKSSMLRGTKEVAESDYLTDAFAREAVSFIDHQSPDNPFFLYVAFNAVHTPLQATQEYMDRFAHVEELERRIYYAMTSAMDDAVGDIVAAIEKRGLDKNTMLVFLNDNGGPLYTGVQSNAPLRMGKMFLFEGGVRVPLIIKWPGVVKKGQVEDGVVSALDLLPTFCAAAGATLPSPLETDGIDLRSWLDGQRADSASRSIFWRNGENKAVRSGKWKLVEIPGHVWLFDLESDVGEKENLAEEQSEVVQDLRSKLRAWESSLSAPTWPPKADHPVAIIDGIEYRVNI